MNPPTADHGYTHYSWRQETCSPLLGIRALAVARWSGHLFRAHCASAFAEAMARQAAQSRTASVIYDKRVPSFTVSRYRFMNYQASPQLLYF